MGSRCHVVLARTTYGSFGWRKADATVLGPVHLVYFIHVATYFYLFMVHRTDAYQIKEVSNMPFVALSGLAAGILAIIAGIAIIIWPRIIAFIAGIYLVIVGIIAVISSFK